MADIDPLHCQLLRIFSEQLQCEVPSVETDLIENALLDSMQFVDLMMLLEQDFHVTISLAELELDELRSIASIASFVARRVDAARNIANLCEATAR